MSKPPPNSDFAAFVARWRTCGPRLTEQSNAELRQLSLQRRQQQIDNLLHLGYEFRRQRIDDGLVRWAQVMRRLNQT